MSSGFLLVETVPGREAHVLDLLATIPGVTHRSLLFPAAIAVKLEGAKEALAPLARQLARLDGVTATRLYKSNT